MCIHGCNETKSINDQAISLENHNAEKHIVNKNVNHFNNVDKIIFITLSTLAKRLSQEYIQNK